MGQSLHSTPLLWPYNATTTHSHDLRGGRVTQSKPSGIHDGLHLQTKKDAVTSDEYHTGICKPVVLADIVEIHEAFSGWSRVETQRSSTVRSLLSKASGLRQTDSEAHNVAGTTASHRCLYPTMVHGDKNLLTPPAWPWRSSRENHVTTKMACCKELVSGDPVDWGGEVKKTGCVPRRGADCLLLRSHGSIWKVTFAHIWEASTKNVPQSGPRNPGSECLRPANDVLLPRHPRGSPTPSLKISP